MLKRVVSFYKRFAWSPEKRARFQGVKIGLHCNIQEASFGSEPYLISIGNHVQITNGVKIFTHGAAWILRNKHPDVDFFGKVEIKNNVYIGNNALIMPGVTVGSNVIIAAGSVVAKSIPDNVIVAGNPAKIVSSIDSFEKKILTKNTNSKRMSSSDKRNFLLSLPNESFIRK